VMSGLFLVYLFHFFNWHRLSVSMYHILHKCSCWFNIRLVNIITDELVPVIVTVAVDECTFLRLCSRYCSYTAQS